MSEFRWPFENVAENWAAVFTLLAVILAAVTASFTLLQVRGLREQTRSALRPVVVVDQHRFWVRDNKWFITITLANAGPGPALSLSMTLGFIDPTGTPTNHRFDSNLLPHLPSGEKVSIDIELPILLVSGYNVLVITTCMDVYGRNFTDHSVRTVTAYKIGSSD